jgi:hypothetical protein
VRSIPRIRDIPRSLLTLLASPFTLLEKSKGRWRSAILILYALLALLICTPFVRKARLNRIPDLGDPFDVAAFRDGGRGDAFPLYQEAMSRYGAPSTHLQSGSSTSLFDSVRAVRLNKAYIKPDVEAWFVSNREARDLWVRATAQPGLSYHPWDGRGFGAEFYDGGQVTDPKTGKRVSLRIDDPGRGMLRWLAHREAMRLEREGDLAGAWTWHLAALRYSRHVGMRTIFADRHQAVTLHREACDQAESWATDDRVDAATLRRALADARAVGAMTPPLSDAIKADYLEAMFLLDHPPPDLVDRVRENFAGTLERSPHGRPSSRATSGFHRVNGGLEREGDRFQRYALPDLVSRVMYYFDGEPERSKRLVRQVYANWLAHCDEPAGLQPGTITDLNLFAAPSSSSSILSADDLVRELDRPGPARHVLPRWKELQKPLQDERSRQARLVVTLAGELYLREHGRRPSSPQELVGPYLGELPDGYVDETPSGTNRGTADSWQSEGVRFP